MSDEVTVTIRVPRELKGRIQAISKDMGISQSAVWKILLLRTLRQAADGDLQKVVEDVTLRSAESNTRDHMLEPRNGLPK